MGAQNIKREYVPPMARGIGSQVATGDKVKPMGLCQPGASPHGNLCSTGVFYASLKHPIVDHCNPTGKNAYFNLRLRGRCTIINLI